MSAIIKPLIYASASLPSGDNISLKPSIYVSALLPSENSISLKPLIYATILREPVSVEITGDTFRKVNKSSNISFDTLRSVKQTNNIIADTTREIVKTENVIADTEREVVKTEKVVGDLFRVVKKTEIIVADTLIALKGVATTITGDTKLIIGVRENISGDTLRQVNKTEFITADTLRNVITSGMVIADTLRRVSKTEKITFDTSIKSVRSEIISADTLVKSGFVESITADTLRNITHTVITTGDLLIRIPHSLRYVIENAPAFLSVFDSNPQSLTNTFKDYGITSFSITLNEKTLSDTFNLETARGMEIQDAVKGQLLDYPFSFLVEETSQRDLIQTVKGMYDVDRLLYTQIFYSGLSVGDNKTYFVSAGAYIAQMAKYMGLRPICLIRDFFPYHDFTKTNITYSDLLNSVFGWTSRLPHRQVNVFIREGVLYCIQRGRETAVFDITDLPHSRPTVDKKLIRSLWNNPKPDDDEKSDDDEPVTEYGEDVEIARPFSGTISYSDRGSSVTYRYSRGLLARESKYTENSQFRSSAYSTYTYDEIIPSDTSLYDKITGNYESTFYLAEKKSDSTTYQYGTNTEEVTVEVNGKSYTQSNRDDKMIETSSTSEYFYKKTKSGELYLYEEFESNRKKTYIRKLDFSINTDSHGVQSFGGFKEKWELEDSEAHTRQTFHVPIGNGWYATSVNVDGDPQGSTLSQGKPGNKVTPYTINEVQKSFDSATITPLKDPNDPDDPDNKKTPEEKYRDWRKKLAPIVDTSFPVRDIGYLYTLTDEIYWLNRKTQEDVTVEIIDKIVGGIPSINHIVDFTERVKFNGNEYFLVSNNIRFTPRKLSQTLHLVRWY